MQKYRRLFVVFLLILFPLFFVGGPDPFSPRPYRVAWDFGHIIFFSIAAYLLLNERRFIGESSLVVRLVWVLIISFVVGAMIELVQVVFSREMSWGDVLKNLAGALLGFFMYLLCDRPVNSRLLWGLGGFIAVLMGLLLTPLLQVVVDEYRFKNNFPVLVNFESTRELSRWRGQAQFSLSDQYFLTGNYSLNVELGDKQYSGVELNKPLGDWQGYDGLSFDIYNPVGERLELVIRVHDRAHHHGGQLFSDRYNGRFSFEKGWNRVLIPMADIIAAPQKRSMNISEIAGIVIFSTNKEKGRQFFLDNVTLIKVTP